jgi:hypothetical protein
MRNEWGVSGKNRKNRRSLNLSLSREAADRLRAAAESGHRTLSGAVEHLILAPPCCDGRREQLDGVAGRVQK